MKTVKEVSRLTGVSVRTLHHYDAIGLLRPSQISPAGYRLYDDEALEKLSMILVCSCWVSCGGHFVIIIQSALLASAILSRKEPCGKYVSSM